VLSTNALPEGAARSWLAESRGCAGPHLSQPVVKRRRGRTFVLAKLGIAASEE